MRWQVKAAVQATLSRVPYSHVIYRTLQQLAGTTRLDVAEQYARKAHFIRRMQSQALPIEGKEFLEIGTGWHPVLPLLLHLLGAKRVVTLDLNPWLTRTTLADTLRGLLSLSSRISHDFALPAESIEHKLCQFSQAAQRAGALAHEILRVGDIEYLMPRSASDTYLESTCIDYIVSSNVLEHIPPDVIENILTESKRVLKPGGMHLHHINPGDHFALDQRISKVNFLRYSESVWYFIGGSGIAYHNRLRGIDYKRMLESHKFTVTYEATNIDRRSLEVLQTGRLRCHPAFNSYSAEELACDLIDIFAHGPTVHDSAALEHIRPDRLPREAVT